MDETAKQTIESTLTKLTGDTKKALKSTMLTICLQGDVRILTPAMTNNAVIAFERGAKELIKEATAQVLLLSRAPEAYELIHDSVSSYFVDAKTVINGGDGMIVSAATIELAVTGFDGACERLLASLDSHRYKFPIPKNSGGRPMAKEWFDLMAHFVAKANSPDGLLVGKLDNDHLDRDITYDELQADMVHWFAANTDKSPEPKELKKPIDAILKALSKHRKQKN